MLVKINHISWTVENIKYFLESRTDQEISDILAMPGQMHDFLSTTTVDQLIYFINNATEEHIRIFLNNVTNGEQITTFLKTATVDQMGILMSGWTDEQLKNFAESRTDEDIYNILYSHNRGEIQYRIDVYNTKILPFIVVGWKHALSTDEKKSYIARQLLCIFTYSIDAAVNKTRLLSARDIVTCYAISHTDLKFEFPFKNEHVLHYCKEKIRQSGMEGSYYTIIKDFITLTSQEISDEALKMEFNQLCLFKLPMSTALPLLEYRIATLDPAGHISEENRPALENVWTAYKVREAEEWEQHNT